MKFCPQCGVKLESAGKFCPGCGLAFALENQQQKATPPTPPPASAVPPVPPVPAVPPAARRELKQNGERFSLSGRVVIIIATLLVTFAGLAYLAVKGAGKDKPEGSGTLQPRELQPEWKDALGVTMEFRKTAVSDYDKAVASLCSSKAQLLFEQLNGKIWSIAKPDIGWSWFLDNSLYTVAGVETGNPLAAYYNPWSDCFLLLGMKKKDGKLTVDDVEVVPADCIRRSGKMPFDFNSRWADESVFPPETIASTFVASIKAFEALFPDGAEKDWRKKCVPQIPEIWKTIIYPAASIACGSALLTVSEFRSGPDPDLPVMKALQPAINDAIRQCRESGLSKFAAGTKATPAVCLEAVQKAGDDAFRGLQVAYAITGKSTAFAFCMDPKTPGMCVAFSCRLIKDKMVVERVDLIHFQSIYISSAAQK